MNTSTTNSASNSKKFDAKKMQNINLMEQLSILRPISWIEWDTWTGADSDDCSDDNSDVLKEAI